MRKLSKAGSKSKLNEVKYLKQLNHPNIIKFYEAFTYDNKLWLVLDYAEQGDMQTLVRAQKAKHRYFSEIYVWNVAYQLWSGLLYLRSQNVIHRDIKSLNIYIYKDEVVKIGDFSEASGVESHINQVSK